MTKRVLDDLVDYAHFASAAPPHWTNNVVLPTIKRYLLIVASRLSFLRDQQFISSCRAETSSKNCNYRFICLPIPVLCSSTSRDLHLIFDPTCLPVP